MTDAASRFKVDYTVRLDVVAGTILALVTGVALFVTVQIQGAQNARDIDANKHLAEKDVARVEALGARENSRIESIVIDKIKGQQSEMERVNMRVAEDIREMKGLLSKIDDKLDKKADKPGR